MNNAQTVAFCQGRKNLKQNINNLPLRPSLTRFLESRHRASVDILQDENRVSSHNRKIQ